MEIKTSKLLTNPSTGGWVFVHEFSPQEKEKLVARGHLVALFSQKSEAHDIDPKEVPVLAKEVLTRLQEEYFGILTGTPLDRLNEAVAKVTEEFSDDTHTLEISAGVFMGDTLFLTVSNGASVYLYRGNNLAKVIGSQDKETVFGSGKLFLGDKVVFVNGSFTKAFSDSALREVLAQNISPEQVTEALSLSTHKENGFGNTGAIVAGAGEFVAPYVTPGEGIRESEGRRGLNIKKPILLVVEKAILILEKMQLPFKKMVSQKSLTVGSDTKDFGEVKKKKTAVTAGIIILLLLGVSIVFGIRQAKVRGEKKEVATKVSEIRHDLDEAKSLAGLDTSRARELMMGAKDKAESLKAMGVKDTDLENLLTEINGNLGSVGGIYEPEVKLYLDLGLLSSGFEGGEISLSEGRMLVLDTNASKLVSIDIATKKTEVLAGPDDIGGAKGVSAYATRNFVITDSEILEVDSKGVGLVKRDDWEGRALLKAYTGNLYLLETASSKVFKYQGLGGSEFGDKVEWFSKDTESDLSDAVSWGIDGAVWVLKRGGIIRKFTLGKPDPFSAKGLDKPITNATDMFVDEDAQSIYILDPENERVVLVDKTGEFKAEYISPEIKNAKKIIVSEKDKKLILLTGSQLKEIELKHL